MWRDNRELSEVSRVAKVRVQRLPQAVRLGRAAEDAREDGARRKQVGI